MEAALAEIFAALLQLDELALAEWSPVGGADEHQHQTLGPAQRGESLAVAVLVDSFELGDVRAYRGSGCDGSMQRECGEKGGRHQSHMF